MKTQVKNKTSFDTMKEGFSNSNKVAKEAIAEQTDAATPVYNNSAPAKRLKERATSASAGSAKLKTPKRSHRNENGIAENVTSGEGMVDVLLTFEPIFNPIIPAHLPASLTARNVEGRVILSEVRDTKQIKTNDGNARRVIFDILNKMFTRVFNQLVVCGAPEGTINNAKSIIDEMRSKRKGTPKLGAKTRSISQRSFNKMVDHVSDFLVLLANCPEYDSNVDELKLVVLQAYRDSLLAGNATVSKSKAEMDTSMIERNEFFNAKYKGFVDTYQAVKRSVKVIYGADSPQYHQVAHFKFRKIRD